MVVNRLGISGQGQLSCRRVVHASVGEPCGYLVIQVYVFLRMRNLSIAACMGLFLKSVANMYIL